MSDEQNADRIQDHEGRLRAVEIATAEQGIRLTSVEAAVAKVCQVAEEIKGGLELERAEKAREKAVELRERKARDYRFQAGIVFLILTAIVGAYFKINTGG